MSDKKSSYVLDGWFYLVSKNGCFEAVNLIFVKMAGKRIVNEISLDQIDDFFSLRPTSVNHKSIPRACERPQRHKHLLHSNPTINQPEPKPEYVPTYKR